jgi:hypothetical protein
MPSDTSAHDPISEPQPPRKKPRRLWLFAPYAALILLFLGYSAFWLVVRGRIEGAIDARAEAMRQAGYTVDLGRRRVDGYPFRLKISLSDLRIVSPGGWGVAAPTLTGEAYIHDPGHWVLVAPTGLTVTRPEGGAVAISGQALRASIAGVDRTPWRIVLQADKPVFTPAPGARPFSLARADLLELYLKPAPKAGNGLVLFRMEGAHAAPETLLFALAGPAPVTATLQGELTGAGAFRGGDWGEAVRAWARSGGRLQAVQGTASADKTVVKANGGTLSVGGDGRVVGTVPLQLTRAATVFDGLARADKLDPNAAAQAAAVATARAQGQATNLDLVFQAGATTVGPIRIGPSPKVG